MDNKSKIIKFCLILLAFTLVCAGSSLLIIGAINFNYFFIYTSFVLLFLGVVIYIVLIFMFFKYFKNKK